MLTSLDTFLFAVRNLDEGLKVAGESTLDFLHRLAAATLEAAQTDFAALFSRPTQEDAQINLQLARLRAQRAALLVGGRSEEELERLLKPIDDEIDAIEKANALRNAENGVLKAQADVADKTLLTDRELLMQAHLLITTIASQSFLTDTLNSSLLLQDGATQRAITSLHQFADALDSGRIKPGVTINVTVQGGGNERSIAEAAEIGIRNAQLGGSIQGTGAFST